MRYRIVKYNKQYYVQFRKWYSFKWHYMTDPTHNGIICVRTENEARIYLSYIGYRCKCPVVDLGNGIV